MLNPNELCETTRVEPKFSAKNRRMVAEHVEEIRRFVITGIMKKDPDTKDKYMHKVLCLMNGLVTDLKKEKDYD